MSQEIGHSDNKESAVNTERKVTPHSLLPRHCAVCGVDWPKGNNGICRSCKAGLACRADTTDTVAPDPPCMGSRARLADA